MAYRRNIYAESKPPFGLGSIFPAEGNKKVRISGIFAKIKNANPNGGLFSVIFAVFCLFCMPAAASENLIENLRPRNEYITITDGILRQNIVDSAPYIQWKLYSKYDNQKHAPSGGTQSHEMCFIFVDENTGFISRTFTTPADTDDYMHFAFGLNGKAYDTLVRFDIKDMMPNTTYTIQWRVLNATQGEVAWTDMRVVHCEDGYSLALGDENCSRPCENQPADNGYIPPDVARVYESEMCTYDPSRIICDAGYYLLDGGCTKCPGGHYCPGDNTKIQCPANATDFYAEYGALGYKVLDVDVKPGSYCFVDDPSASIDRCCLTLNVTTTEGIFGTEGKFVDGRYVRVSNEYRWYKAQTGYYLSGYSWSSGGSNWYNGVKACANAPDNAHYTGSGTPDEPKKNGAADYNDCPWVCDDGYGQTGDVQCVHLCTAGITKIRAGDVTVPLYSVRQTTPAINVRVPGQSVCYGSLVVGRTNGALNVKIGDAVYHSVW